MSRLQSGDRSNLVSVLGVRGEGVDAEPFDTRVLVAERFGDEAVGDVETHCVRVGFSHQALMPRLRVTHRTQHATSDAGPANVLSGSDVQDHEVGSPRGVTHHANRIAGDRRTQHGGLRVSTILFGDLIDTVRTTADRRRQQLDHAVIIDTGGRYLRGLQAAVSTALKQQTGEPVTVGPRGGRSAEYCCALHPVAAQTRGDFAHSAQ